jgi:hypothetical protein
MLRVKASSVPDYVKSAVMLTIDGAGRIGEEELRRLVLS